MMHNTLYLSCCTYFVLKSSISSRALRTSLSIPFFYKMSYSFSSFLCVNWSLSRLDSILRPSISLSIYLTFSRLTISILFNVDFESSILSPRCRSKSILSFFMLLYYLSSYLIWSSSSLRYNLPYCI